MANPTLNHSLLKSALYDDKTDSLTNNNVMTINGTILKTCFLGLLMMTTFAYSWHLLLTGFMDKANTLCHLGIFGGLALVLFICFAPKNNSLIITTPLYALCEGLALGYISIIANTYYPGVAFEAALATMFALFGMFFLYRTNMVKCTEKFKMIVMNCTFAILAIYLLQFVLSFFKITIPGIFSNSLVGIGFSIFFVAVATFNLIIDFDDIERFSGNAPKQYEWYFGFSLLVTIVWMYIEILNLLMKLRRR